MSLINDVLNIVRLDVQVYHNARVCGNWQIREGHIGRACFHMSTNGDCLLTVPGEGEWLLREGDVVIFPEEIPHQMVSQQPLTGEQQHLRIAESMHLEGTNVLCGELLFQHAGGKQLMRLLPNVMVLSAEAARHWLGPVTQLIVAESMQDNLVKGSPTASPVLNRLCELLMVFSFRCMCENYAHEGNLLALYADSKLSKAVTAIHKDPADKWTLERLAKEAGMSRTPFSDLFSKVAGMTAMNYLAWWRMQLAWAELEKGQSVDDVADKVGYSSEAAFARAFKKQFDQTVGSVRAQSVRT